MAAEPQSLNLFSAFLAMEPVDSLLFMARELGGGLVTEAVQRFIWDHCISKAQEMSHFHVPYMKNFLKKLISEVESSQGEVLDGLYEVYASYMVSWKDENLGKENARVSKVISFLFPNVNESVILGSSSCQKSRKFMVPLQSSLNMLEGDTGCSIWPSSLYLSELVLSFPDIFSTKECFEVGSGVGLVGICLAHVNASKVVLSDGDLSTLANMKVNLELNALGCLSSRNAAPEKNIENLKIVKCIHLPWESATEIEFLDFQPDVVLGADVIYDPLCLPHLVRVLSILLRQKRNCSVAYIASVIRNSDTFNCFLGLVEQANLNISDVTDEFKPLNLLPYMYSYDRSSIRLFTLRIK